MTARRRRGLLLLSVSLASGGLAASQVHEREQRAAEELGPSVEVLAAARDLPAGARVTPAAIAARRVPARFVPPDALPAGRGGEAAASGLLGARVAVPVAAGSYLTAGLFQGVGAEDRRTEAERGERVVTVEVAGGGALAGLAEGGALAGPSSGGPLMGPSSAARVDVLVSTEAGPGGGRTVMALAGAELLGLGDTPDAGYPDPDAGAGIAAGPTALATLRVSVRQAIYLTAADNFAREIRLLARPKGDPSHAGGTISEDQL